MFNVFNTFNHISSSSVLSSSSSSSSSSWFSKFDKIKCCNSYNQLICIIWFNGMWVWRIWNMGEVMGSYGKLWEDMGRYGGFFSVILKNMWYNIYIERLVVYG